MAATACEVLVYVWSAGVVSLVVSEKRCEVFLSVARARDLRGRGFCLPKNIDFLQFHVTKVEFWYTFQIN